MADKIRCADCEHCKGVRKMNNTRYEFSCEHPDESYIKNYFMTHKIKKMYGFLGFGKPFSKEAPIKTSPAWCPKKKQEGGK